MTRRGLIFDLDGTLVDSGLDFEAMRQEMELPPGTAILEAIDALPADRAAACRDILHRHELAGVQRARLMPSARELVERLQSAGVPTAVLTRNSRDAALATLERLSLAFPWVFAREDAPAKPDPTAIHQIRGLWQLPAHDVAIVGDYRFDLEAGRRAGAYCVLYTAGRDLSHLEWARDADLWLECFTRPEKLLAWLDAGPESV